MRPSQSDPAGPRRSLWGFSYQLLSGFNSHVDSLRCVNAGGCLSPATRSSTSNANGEDDEEALEKHSDDRMK
jgi:hypothetical protein